MAMTGTKAVTLLLCVSMQLAVATSSASTQDDTATLGSSESLAPSRFPRWRAEPGFSVALRSDYVESNDRSTSFATMAATAQIRMRSPSERFALGLLVEHAVMQDRDDSTLIAGVFAYAAGRWSLAFAPYLKTAGGSSEWKHQSTVRYRLGSRSAVGVELIGPLSTASGSRMSLAYYGKLTRSMAMTLMAGSGIDAAGPDRTLRAGLSWTIR